jgi:hypothetical protein
MMYSAKLRLKCLPRWSIDGVAGPISGTALSHDITVVNPNLVDVIIANTPEDDGPETVGIIQIGASNTVYSLSELN